MANRWHQARKGSARLHLTVGLAALCCLLLPGCFQVREPVAPQSANGEWTPPTEPDILIQNLGRAVSSVNITNYERCFNGAAYTFVPDPSVAVSSQAVFGRWTIVEEVEYLKNIALATNPPVRNSFTVTNTRKQFISVDSLEYNTEYTYMLYTSDNQFTANSIKGRAIFYLRRKPNTEWVISRWQDSRTGTEPSFSDVKRHFIAP